MQCGLGRRLGTGSGLWENIPHLTLTWHWRHASNSSCSGGLKAKSHQRFSWHSALLPHTNVKRGHSCCPAGLLARPHLGCPTLLLLLSLPMQPRTKWLEPAKPQFLYLSNGDEKMLHPLLLPGMPPSLLLPTVQNPLPRHAQAPSPP